MNEDRLLRAELDAQHYFPIKVEKIFPVISAMRIVWGSTITRIPSKRPRVR